MKTISIMVTILTCMVWFTAASAMDVKFQWDPNTESDLAGYKLYYGIDDLANPLQQDVTNQTVATISGLDPARNYAFAVVAYNTSWLESSYSNVVKVLESVLPTVSITSPSNNAKVSNTVSIAVSASDNIGVTKVEFYLDGVLKATQAAGPYLYSWDTLAVTAGTHTITAKAYDAAENVGVSTVSVNVVNDVTSPVITNIIPVQGSSVKGVIKVSADATDNVGVTMVEFYANGALLFAGNVAPYTYNWNTALVANGSYTLTVKAYDNAGNIGQSSNIPLTVFNDTTAPTGATSAPAGNAAATPPSVPVYTISDALLALRIVVGAVNPTQEQRVRVDVAPVDGKIEISDALSILRYVVGLQKLVL